MKRKEFITVFDKQFATFLDEQCASVHSHFSDDTFQALTNYIKQFHQGGKRIRPYLVYLLHQGFGGTHEHILQLSMSNELIHLFALIHDDIIDKGTIRHNIPTYHLHAAALYKDDHIGSAQAMLLGDLVYTRAWKNVLKYCDNISIMQLIISLAEEVVIGEMIDVHMSASQHLYTAKEILFKDKIKSGYYTFTRPMMLGAKLANVEQTTLDHVEALGNNIATAFQLRDDLMDCIDTHANKTTFSDLQEGNQTILLHNTLVAITESEREYILNNRGKKLDADTISIIQSLIKKSGALQETAQLINHHLALATEQLADLPLMHQTAKDALQDIITYLKISEETLKLS